VKKGQKLIKKGINSCRKGKNFERRVANLFSKAWNVEAYKTPGSGSFGTTHRSRALKETTAADVVIEGIPVTIECKDYKTIGVFNWLRTEKKPKQSIEFWWEKVCKEAAEIKSVPLLVLKSDRTPIAILMSYQAYNHFVDYTGGTPNRLIKFKSQFEENLICININDVLALDKSQILVILNNILKELYG